jgi:hypothetical protein
MLSDTEKEIINWLAIEHQPVSFFQPNVLVAEASVLVLGKLNAY